MKKRKMKFISMALSIVLGAELAMAAVPAQVVKADQVVQMEQDTLPGKFSSIDHGFMTKIRNQGNYGNCWAHSALSCMEISMVKEKIAPADGLELSIPHGMYYYYRPVADPLGGTADDYVNPNKITVYDMLNDGGYAYFVGRSVLAWQGPVLAEDFFTSGHLQGSYNAYDSAKDLHTEAYAYGNKAAIVTEAVNMIGIDHEDIKRAIVEYGSVGINYNSNSSYYNSEHAAHYCPNHENVTHAVTAVGWDDHFPKENFHQTPVNDGAWLVDRKSVV